ncbi:stigma-specific STIG1-like protein 1 [Magnolia sinica]|uniref:stigma-specific STIG1-like protein 1 n=1 Tax=Magnolia sinica TaxID=86752 RepID=UPI00265B3007|nr:stigma-specific STIG1-like protein 1 [Magnolia sinica]
MKLVKTIFIMAIAMALIMACTGTVTVDEVADSIPTNLPSSQDHPSSLRGISRFLAQEKPKTLKCWQNPDICLPRGSPGPSCCRNKCVNLITDRGNCGVCGKMCKYTEACCRGECVYLSFDKRHCGRCNNRCAKSDYCIYGMCNYA